MRDSSVASLPQNDIKRGLRMTASEGLAVTRKICVSLIVWIGTEFGAMNLWYNTVVDKEYRLSK